MIIITIVIIIIIPPSSCVHQMSWTSHSLISLLGPRNLGGIFEGCELFPVVLHFGFDLVGSCQALRFSDILRDFWVLLPGLRSQPAMLLPSFP